ncbi:MAG: hypothetical protein U5N53_22860 [Mycobacterium sp.]|nr:hypothetical protein [Mycobacterium sp.]
MAADQHGGTVGAAVLVEMVEDRFRRSGINTCGGLIAQEDRRAGKQRAGERNPPKLPTRQIVGCTLHLIECEAEGKE